MLCKALIQIFCVNLLMALVCCSSSLETFSPLDHLFLYSFFFSCSLSGLIAICLKPFFLYYPLADVLLPAVRGDLKNIASLLVS